ncbi:MAG TPA: lysylphosphatidylglycerol synthase transmembrane domain-containing protein [Anaerolineae bacterium]|nr:lysylphosphatidylglycerol synthase transmembrane domain-containing protein [Anaerolineae bacterium]HOQ99460.1 lysylphosphatidylglycerol synthase transmembrane domain-containing protein [Anaerolineae bacterium]HPL28695.1 lysylphosphatidylglycerol synthase transmembrane domain-containing protein [Anaerolineae bacterium]
MDKGRLRLLVGLAISALCLYLVLRAVDLGTLAEAYRGADYRYLVPALALTVLINWARAYRWRLLMHPHDRQPLGRVFSIVNIGYLFNNVLPAKAGEVVRGYLAGRLLPGGLAQALSTLLVERLLDVLSVVLLLAGLLPFVDLPAWATTGRLLFGLAALVGTAALVALARLGSRGLDWVWRYLGRLPLLGHARVRAALANVLEGLRVLTVPRLLPGIVLWSLLVWLGYVLLNYTMMAAFHVTGLVPQPLLASAVIVCATGLSMVVPSSPGAFGPVEGAVIFALGLYGVDQSRAFAYAFGQHAFNLLVLVALGLWGLRSESLTFAGIREQALGEAPAGAEERRET